VRPTSHFPGARAFRLGGIRDQFCTMRSHCNKRLQSNDNNKCYEQFELLHRGSGIEFDGGVDIERLGLNC
jgi:hypothetical protein